MSEDVFGIDLGTTYSAIAHMDEYGRPQIIQNRDGQNTTPSVVYFESASNFVVGQEAKNGARVYPDETVSLIKREMGEKNERIFFDEPFYPETISSLILKQLVAEAQEATGSTSSRVVITVPAYFGLAEKEATRHAGQIAGLDVVGILAEPVAAALSTGITSAQDKCYFVYDLGGGTFDCTVLRTAQDTFEVVATDGNRKLGGADWDEALFDLVLSKFVQEKGIDDDPAADPEFYQGLMNDVESAKKTLSKKEKARLRCSYEGVQGVVNVTREEFEAATRPLLNETLDIVQRTLDAATAKEPGLSIDEILLVGGSSRMPQVAEGLSSRFPWPLRNTEFDLAVAQGAAIYGNGVQPAVSDGTGSEDSAPAAGLPGLGSGQEIVLDGRQVTFTNVLSKSVGVRFFNKKTKEHYIGFLAHAQDKLPIHTTMTAFTIRDHQTSVEVQLYEQSGETESREVEHNKRITPEGVDPRITGLPDLPEGSPIELTLSITNEGLASLRAVEPTSGHELTLEASLSPMQPEELEQARGIVSRMSISI